MSTRGAWSEGPQCDEAGPARPLAPLPARRRAVPHAAPRLSRRGCATAGRKQEVAKPHAAGGV
jgi:hypothetical protein